LQYDINRRDRAYTQEGGGEEKGNISLIQGLSVNNHCHANSNLIDYLELVLANPIAT
jgi:hypothetical protein